jgi:hypothetical protein
MKWRKRTLDGAENQQNVATVMTNAVEGQLCWWRFFKWWLETLESLSPHNSVVFKMADTTLSAQEELVSQYIFFAS